MSDVAPAPDVSVASLRRRVDALDQTVSQRGRQIRAAAPKLRASAAAGAGDLPLLGAMIGGQVLIVALALLAVAVWSGRPPVPTGEVGGSLLAATPPEPAPPEVSVDVTPTVGVTPTVDVDDVDVDDVDVDDVDDAVVDAVADVAAPPPPATPPPPVAAPPLAAPPTLTRISTFPATVTGDTSTSTTTEIDRYGCAPGRIEGGSEVWHEVVLSRRGFLTAWIAEEPRADVDVDLHLLSARDASACLRRGHIGVAATLDPGTYWLVVDTFTGSRDIARPGPFTLEVTLAPR